MRRSIYLAVTAVVVAGALNSVAAQAPAKSSQQKAAKAQPPAALPLKPVAFPPFAEASLSQGAQLLVVENHEQPVVSVNIYIKGAGQVSDTDAKPGVASATAALLDAGTKSKTSKQIAETIEGMGANLNTNATQEWATISATMLKSDVDQVLAVIADVLLNPTFPADELETERKRALTDLQVALSRPATLAQRQFEASVFGKHPYGRLTTTAAIRSITREDIVAFHQNFYKPSNALVVVAGDITEAEIKPKLEQHLAVWTGQGPARPQFAAAPAMTERQIILVNKPGAVQAAFRIGHTIVPATHQDWPALVVAHQVLGGSANAWLNDNLREKKGFTYGAFSQASQRLDPGFFMMVGDVRNEVADSSLELFITLAQQLKSKPVPAEDLERAKAWLTGNFPLTIETPTQIAGQVATSRLLGQSKDHVQTWRTRIAAVTAADVQRVAKAHLHPENAIVVVSGDASVIKPKLEKFAKVTVVDEEGRPVAAAAPADAPGAQPQAAAQTPAPIVDGSSIQPQTLTYVINAQGMQVAEMTRTVTRENDKGKDIVKAVAATSGMFTGSSEVKFEAKTFKPLSSSMQQQAGGREMSSLLTASNGKVSGMLTMPDSDPKVIDAALPEGTILPGMDEFAIWVNDLSANKEMKFNVFNAMSNSIVPVTMKVTGESKQKVAAGEFDVYELEMQTAQGGIKAYVRKAAPHIMVKQEMLAQPVVVELKALK